MILFKNRSDGLMCSTYNVVGSVDSCYLKIKIICMTVLCKNRLDGLVLYSIK